MLSLANLLNRASSEKKRLVRGNLLVDNDVGVNASTNGNETIIQNCAIGNTGGSYNGSTGNDIGPIGSASSATSPWANISH